MAKLAQVTYEIPQNVSISDASDHVGLIIGIGDVSPDAYFIFLNFIKN